MITIRECHIIRGRAPDLPVKLPRGAQTFKLRCRAGQWAQLFIFYPHKVEQWHVTASDDGYLRPFSKIGENRRA